MSLSRVQRDAMVSAQRGDWQLADALEVSQRDPYDGWDCIGGILQGGRLQMLAFGTGCGCADGEDCDQAGGDIEVIVGLDDRVVWRQDPHDDQAPFYVDMTRARAASIMAAYEESLANPTQTHLIEEAA